MRMDLRQQARLAQQMRMSPQMIQSMEILQLPLEELDERIDCGRPAGAEEGVKVH